MKHEVKGGAGGYYFVANIVNLHDQAADQSVPFALQHLVKSPQNNLMTSTKQRTTDAQRTWDSHRAGATCLPELCPRAAPYPEGQSKSPNQMTFHLSGDMTSSGRRGS